MTFIHICITDKLFSDISSFLAWNITDEAESRWKTDRKEWEWEEEARSFTSKGKVQRRFCSMEGCKAKLVTYCGKCDGSVCIDHYEEYHTKS